MGTHLLRHGLHTGVLLLLLEELGDLAANLTIGHLDVVLGVAVVVHKGEEAIVRNVKLKINISIVESATRIWNPFSENLQAGTRGERRWERPYCG